MCCRAGEQAPPGPVIVYDYQGRLMPFTDDQDERVDWAQAWARVHGRPVLATVTDDAAAATLEGARPGWERVVALLAEHPDALVLVHRPEALHEAHEIRSVLAMRVGGRIITTTGEDVRAATTDEVR